MPAVVDAFLSTLGTLFRSQLSLRVENVALRHQLAIYQRTVKRPSIRPADRVLWCWLSRRWARWREVLAFVGNRLAAQTLSRSLGAREQNWEARTTADQRGDTRAHP